MFLKWTFGNQSPEIAISLLVSTETGRVQVKERESVLSVRVIDSQSASIKLICNSSTVQGYPGYSTTTTSSTKSVYSCA